MKNGENIKLTPEMLAAFADGELGPCECRAVEQWLADHPEARADVDGQRRLADLWRATPPREPDESTWIAALAGIEGRLPAASPPVSRRRLPFAWMAGLAAAAAVAAIIVFAANRTPPPDTRIADEVPLPVVSHEDILITSLADADDGLLLVGDPPIKGPLHLVDPGDIRIQDMQAEPGMNPKFHEEPGAPPMIITQPPDAAEVKQP